MRFWVALVGLTLGLSGCIGGHVTTVQPANATADDSDGVARDAEAADDVPPWLIRDAAAADAGDDASKGAATKDEGTPKDEGTEDAPDADADAPSDEPPPPDTSGSDPVQNAIDDAPLQGGSDAGEGLGDAVDETASDATNPSVPKDPLAGSGDLVGAVADALTGTDLPGNL